MQKDRSVVVFFIKTKERLLYSKFLLKNEQYLNLFLEIEFSWFFFRIQLCIQGRHDGGRGGWRWRFPGGAGQKRVPIAIDGTEKYRRCFNSRCVLSVYVFVESSIMKNKPE